MTARFLRATPSEGTIELPSQQLCANQRGLRGFYAWKTTTARSHRQRLARVGPGSAVDMNPLFHISLALIAGVVAHLIAARLALPSIVILLPTGVLIGPDGLGWLDPAQFRAAQAELVSLAVTIILFEGALALRVPYLRQQTRTLGMLLTVGALISLLCGTAAARFFLDMPWNLAWLYGAIVIVTGPTVVSPLLARLAIDRRVREILVAEGVLIDPIGAIFAIVLAEYFLGHAGPWAAGWLVLFRLGVGAFVGAGAGLVLTAALRRGLIPEQLRNPTVLAVVLFAATLASRISAEAGLMAAVAQGVVMANADLYGTGRLRAFKEELTLLFLAFIFVALAAGLPVAEVAALDWRGLAVVASLLWIGRPLAVVVSTCGTDLRWGERVFLAWICPRGIVAASVAGLFGLLLAEKGVAGATRLEALVFVTVAVTVALQGLTAPLVARVTGVNLPSLNGALIVGGDFFGRLVGRLLAARGRQVVIVDNNAGHCAAAQSAGLAVYRGDALQADTLDAAGIRFVDTVLALTRNLELNDLVAQEVREHFRIERVLSVGAAAQRNADRPFPGRLPHLDEVNAALRHRRARVRIYRVPRAVARRLLADLPFADGEAAVLLERRGRVFVARENEVLEEEDTVICLQTEPTSSPLEQVLELVADQPAASLEAESTAPLPGQPRGMESGGS